VYNFHPPLAAFPFALIVTVFILEIVNFFIGSTQLKSVIRVNLYIAGVAVVAAFFSGYQANELADATFKVADELIEAHHEVGRLVMFSTLACAIFVALKDRAVHAVSFFRASYYILLLVSVVLVACTGYLGAELVFKHGAAVSATP